MTAELQEVHAKLDAIMRMLTPRADPPITQVEFARRRGVGRSTIQRELAAGRYALERGRIPATVYRQYLK